MTIRSAIMFAVLVFCTVTVWAVIAFAQSAVVIPVVPTTISPVLQYVLGLVGVVFSVFVPLVSIWLKNYLATQTAVAQKSISNSAVIHAAHLADLDMTRQHIGIDDVGAGTPTMTKALDYVSESCALSGIPDAADDHTIAAITAEIHKIALAKADSVAPSVVLSPVSAVR